MVSVIIPTFNRAHTLSRAIESVVAQTFGDWELIVIDDGSSDETPSVVSQFSDERIKFVRQKRAGVSAARNRGIESTERPWISFLDSDDYWQPTKLERQFSLLDSYPDLSVCYTNEIWIRRGIRVNQKRKHRKYGGWIYEYCLPLCIISPSSVVLRRSLLEKKGRFDESFPVCEDYELWLRLTACNPVLFLDEDLITKTGGHSDQLSRSRWGLDRYRVRALQMCYESQRLTPRQRRLTAREISSKAGVLATGYRNRSKARGAAIYSRLSREWEKEMRRWQI